MNAFDQLRKEHDVILMIARRMEQAVSGPASGESAKPFLLAALAFLRQYAGNHQAKEERALFPIMQKNTMLAGMAAMLADEHIEGRRLTDAIQQTLARADLSLRGLVLDGSVRDYAEFMRDHIVKEDKVIFEAAERELSADDEARLAREFADMAMEELGPDGPDRLLAELDVTHPA